MQVPMLDFQCAESHSSVASKQELRTGGCWFDPWIGQYSFLGLMIATATGFNLLSLPPTVLTMVRCESRLWLEMTIVWSTG